ncbi:MAG: hypothetical protein U1E51_31855 [Candidatus Binatia bacterium]|nr:hypothetical protein [Candidatus Binatia bacterium]
MPDTWWIGDKEYPSHDAAIGEAKNGDIIRCEGDHPCSSCFVTDYQSMVSMMTTGHLPHPKEAFMGYVTEHLIYSDYYQPLFRQSRLIPGLEIMDAEAGQLRCPRCGSLHKNIVHGHGLECPCGLVMWRWGKDLEISDRVE